MPITTRSGGVRKLPPPDLTHHANLEVWLATTDRKNQPEHWVLILRVPNSQRCTWYHMDGGWPPSTYRQGYEANKRFNNKLVPKHRYICTIRGEDQIEVHEAAQKVRPQHCQKYIVSVLRELETSGRDLVPRGTAQGLSMFVTPNLFEGPVRVIGEVEWFALVKRWGKKRARSMTLRIQRWVDMQGNILRRLSWF